MELSDGSGTKPIVTYFGAGPLVSTMGLIVASSFGWATEKNGKNVYSSSAGPPLRV